MTHTYVCTYLYDVCILLTTKLSFKKENVRDKFHIVNLFIYILALA